MAIIKVDYGEITRGGTLEAETFFFAGGVTSGSTKVLTTKKRPKIIIIYNHANAVYTNVSQDGTISETSLYQIITSGSSYQTQEYTNGISITDNSITISDVIGYKENWKFYVTVIESD